MNPVEKEDRYLIFASPVNGKFRAKLSKPAREINHPFKGLMA
jgi:hypothetical protein